MEQYICIHGHFYQPPRENPWLEAIELQDSAYPFHDWNERITSECYAANGASRILDGQGHITEIAKNYARISFNFGPTVLSWMENYAPSSYQAIIAADIESRELFSGHGSALAQAYNHMILPLANKRDKYTQIRWGISDFEHRFSRKPEGMWLAETAVDTDSLEVLAEHGIKFTILSPYQAGRVRPLGGDEEAWYDVSGGRVDPTTPYTQKLPSGRSITLFFYDGPISQGVAFEGLLTQGENLANRLLGAFSEERTWPQLVHIATDGETYGHHHRFGDMALAYALQYIEDHELAHLTIYGEYLEKHPPTHEVEIIENSSWSCYHGVERWRSNCGCNSGMNPGWSQEWRKPLRESLDWLRDMLIPLYEKEANRYVKDPWAVRDDYITIILDRSEETFDNFFKKHSRRALSDSEISKMLKLLELQRHAMLMYTSCGWFFDEISGIETVQIIQYAGRVIQLAKETLQTQELENGFLQRLQIAKSNIPEHGDGATIYEKFVKPAMVDLKKVVAHYAVSSLFTNNSFTSNGNGKEVYCYQVSCYDCQVLEAGKTKLAIGKAHVTSAVTRESEDLAFGVLHFGDHNLTGGVRDCNPQIHEQHVAEITNAFWRADLPETIRLLDKYFLELTYSLRSLFRDEQRNILQVILRTSLDNAESAYRQVYENNAPLMRFLTDLDIPLPKVFRSAADFVLNADLRQAFEHEDIDIERIKGILEEVDEGDIELDTTDLAHTLKHTLEWMEERMLHHPTNLPLLKKIEAVVNLACALPFEVDFWQIQNIYYEMSQSIYPDFQERAANGNETAQTWIEHFTALGQSLSFNTEEVMIRANGNHTSS